MKRIKINELNSKRWNLIAENDSVKWVRIFKGRLTKKRFKTIKRAYRVLNEGSYDYCGHSFDCCGCKCGQYATLEYNNNEIHIEVYESFNY